MEVSPNYTVHEFTVTGKMLVGVENIGEGLLAILAHDNLRMVYVCLTLLCHVETLHPKYQVYFGQDKKHRHCKPDISRN